MAERILSIKQVEGVPASEAGQYSYDWSRFDGYEVETTEQRIRVLITNESQCCESWGYFMSHDDPGHFIGAELRDVRLVDAELVSGSLKNERGGYGLDEGAAMFVNLETDRGTFQLVAYNAHNGYYGHTVRVESRQVATEDRL